MGLELTCDAQGNIRDDAGRFYDDPGGLVDAIRRVKGQLGRFRVTPRKHRVLVRINEGEDWTTRFVVALPDALRAILAQAQDEPTDLAAWSETASLGDAYPRRELPAGTESVSPASSAS